ncbi:MAG: hypothetical protein IJ740_08900 [Ruminococcus sp.]|nr:hypothetical protein [Ruminococcus sp.]
MDLKKPMKYSLILGLSGSVLIPLFYEAYANISRTFAIILLVGWALVCAVRLVRFPVKEGLLAITCMLIYTAGIGVVMYVAIHPAAQSFLEKNSKYYYLTLEEEFDFFKSAALIMLAVYLVFFLRLFFISAIDKIKENREKAGEYIDSAFDSSEDEA